MPEPNVELSRIRWNAATMGFVVAGFLAMFAISSWFRAQQFGAAPQGIQGLPGAPGASKTRICTQVWKGKIEIESDELDVGCLKSTG